MKEPGCLGALLTLAQLTALLQCARRKLSSSLTPNHTMCKCLVARILVAWYWTHIYKIQYSHPDNCLGLPQHLSRRLLNQKNPKGKGNGVDLRAFLLEAQRAGGLGQGQRTDFRLVGSEASGLMSSERK